MSHPSLGLAPHDMTAGHPDAAARLVGASGAVGTRALEMALDRDPTLAGRAGEEGLRRLLRDTEILIDRVSNVVASGDTSFLTSFMDQAVPLYRRRRVPLDDLVNLIESIGLAMASIIGPEERAVGDRAIVEAVGVLRWHRRLGGDARKRNALAAALYKGG